MSFITKDFWQQYRTAAAKTAETAKEKAVVEMVIQQLIDDGIYPSIINSDDMTWYEIDTPEELGYAESKLGKQ